MNPAIQGLLTIAIGVGGCVGYFYFSNQILDRFIFPARGSDAGTQHQPGQHGAPMVVHAAGHLWPWDSTWHIRSSKRSDFP